MTRKNWSREELIIAFNLYCTIAFGQIHNRNPRIISLAKKLNRTPSALSWKLANFSRLDPALKERGIGGAAHGSKLEIDIWEEFYANGEELVFQSQKLLAEIDPDFDITVFEPDESTQITGEEIERIVKVRVNQDFFRKSILAAYGEKCCVTGIGSRELLVASHIIPWSVDKQNRLNPRNGLCLNALYDRAFDRGLITITTDYVVKVSKRLDKNNPTYEGWFDRYDGQEISVPRNFPPDQSLLEYHRANIFKE